MTKTDRALKLQWSLIHPKPDPKHGKPCARSSHGVSLVQNGTRLIVYGGEHVARTPLASEEAGWAADSGTSSFSWRRLNCQQSPPDRIAHAQAVYQNNVYIFGGRAGITMNEQAMNDLWKLDCSGPPGTETWSQVAYETGSGDKPPEPRSFHRMICIGSSLYVFGGCGAAHGRLADLHRFDLETRTWHELPLSQLRGRGGPNFVSLGSGTSLGVVAGFSGEETADGQIFDLAAEKWREALLTTSGPLKGFRPRSVCVAESFPSLGCVIIFGGEVDPSDRGHEGAGGFENDVLVLDEATGALKLQIKASSTTPWPEQRGWSSSASIENKESKTGQFFVFGGLSGDDANPRRLDDLWKLDLALM